MWTGRCGKTGSFFLCFFIGAAAQSAALKISFSPECETKDFNGLREQSIQAFRDGQRCLKSLATPTTLSLAERIATLKSVGIECSHRLAKGVKAEADARTGTLSLSEHLQVDEAVAQRGTIFHESIHLLGYKHGEDFEYPYACEACCFAKTGVSPEVTRAGCELCKAAPPEFSRVAYIDHLKKLNQAYPVEQSLTALLRQKIRNEKGSVAASLEYLQFIEQQGNPVFTLAYAKKARDRTDDPSQRARFYFPSAESYLSQPDVVAFVPFYEKYAAADFLLADGRPEAAAAELLSLQRQPKPTLAAKAAQREPQLAHNFAYLSDSLDSQSRFLAADIKKALLAEGNESRAAQIEHAFLR